MESGNANDPDLCLPACVSGCPSTPWPQSTRTGPVVVVLGAPAAGLPIGQTVSATTRGGLPRSPGHSLLVRDHPGAVSVNPPATPKVGGAPRGTARPPGTTPPDKLSLRHLFGALCLFSFWPYLPPGCRLFSLSTWRCSGHTQTQETPGLGNHPRFPFLCEKKTTGAEPHSSNQTQLGRFPKERQIEDA